MDPLVENEAKLHITNGIEKASSATGVDIKVSWSGQTETSFRCGPERLIVANMRLFF